MTDPKNPITVDEILVLVDKATQLEVEYQQALRIDVGVHQAGMASGEADIALRTAIGALVAERDALARSLRAAKVVIAGLEDRAIRTAQTFAATAQRAADVDGEREANAILTVEVEVLQVDAKRYRWLLDWLQHEGLLWCHFCTPPDAPTGNYWVLRKPAMVKGDSCVGYGKSEEAAIDAAMKEKING